MIPVLILLVSILLVDKLSSPEPARVKVRKTDSNGG